MFAAGILFGWQYALYSAIAIFVSGKVTDAVFTKQKENAGNDYYEKS